MVRHARQYKPRPRSDPTAKIVGNFLRAAQTSPCSAPADRDTCAHSSRENRDAGTPQVRAPLEQMGQNAWSHACGHDGCGDAAGRPVLERNDPGPVRPIACRAAPVEGGGPMEFFPGEAAAQRAPAKYP